MQSYQLFGYFLNHGILNVICILLTIIFVYLWAHYAIFTITKSGRLFKVKKGRPIFEWPDVLFQEKVNVFTQQENTLPLPGHQHSLAMKCFIFGLVICIVVASILEPDFIINNGPANAYTGGGYYQAWWRF